MGVNQEKQPHVASAGEKEHRTLGGAALRPERTWWGVWIRPPASKSHSTTFFKIGTKIMIFVSGIRAPKKRVFPLWGALSGPYAGLRTCGSFSSPGNDGHDSLPEFYYLEFEFTIQSGARAEYSLVTE